MRVQRVAKSKVQVTPDASARLLATMERVNAACSWLATQAMALPPWKRADAFALHRAFYVTVRGVFDLPAQLTVRALAKVAACFERDPHTVPTFRPHGSIPYDARCLTFRAPDAEGVPTSVTLGVLDGRVAGTLRVGGPHHALLRGARGSSVLVLRKGRWSLHTTVEVPVPAPAAVHEFLGVDLGS